MRIIISIIGQGRGGLQKTRWRLRLLFKMDADGKFAATKPIGAVPLLEI